MLASELFRLDNLSFFISLFIGFFSLIVTLYSLGFIGTQKEKSGYYIYIFFTFIASLGAVFANNLLVFMIFWGFLGLLLYLLVGLGDRERTPATAKKTFIIVGGTDALMLLGIGLLWHIGGSFDMNKLHISLNSPWAVTAYLCLAIGAFAKAGAMPFHSWVPDTAEDAPTSVTAFLPASLDKLLGIYFLARLSLDIFQMNAAMNTFLMLVGSFTIVAAVMMALIQHDLKRLLGYHAVSQVGYMVLGIGTANPVGIAGGLFHMLNHAIYKSCLFLSAGAVEKQTGVTDLEKLGGLVKVMPITFVTFLISALAISGVPPLNGFVSKWMIYQGIVETAKLGGYLWVIWLVSAMFGSSLTLASFMKLIHAVFLGQPSETQNSKFKIQNLKEVGQFMYIPTIILAALCVVFGVFAYAVPLKMFILPSLSANVNFSGVWDASLATILLLAGILLGALFYFAGRISKGRVTDVFVGGENLDKMPDMRLSGTDFYNTVRDLGILKRIYNKAETGFFDIYEQGKKIIFGVGCFLQYLHNGVLPTYLVWTLLGMIALFLTLAK